MPTEERCRRRKGGNYNAIGSKGGWLDPLLPSPVRHPLTFPNIRFRRSARARLTLITARRNRQYGAQTEMGGGGSVEGRDLAQ